MVRTLASLGLFLAVATVAFWAWFEPGRDADAQSSPPTCGPAGPFNFNTYEARPASSDAETYRNLINLATEGKLFPSVINVGGESADLRYQGVAKGTRSQRLQNNFPNPANRVPATVYYSIAWIETTWQNASNSVPWGGVGPVLRSFDCGFGLGQVTSGMANGNGTPSVKQSLVGIHPAFNVAEGMRILAWHWNIAPGSRPIAGEGNPAHLEDWYFALWGYNGFAFRQNHPLSPDKHPLRGGSDPDRPIFHCWDSSAPSYATKPGTSSVFGRGDYTYPELVYGCMRHPPTSGGVRLWDPVDFQMPDLDREEIADAFDPEHWGCVSNGCEAMDFPTSFPDDDIEPHEDIVGPVPASMAEDYLGDPNVSFSGPSTANLQARSNGTIDSVNVTATNNGTYIAPFRIRSTASWLVVTDAGGSSSRYMHGNLAVGDDQEIVITNVPQRQTKIGHDAHMRVTLRPQGMPAGPVTGTVYFEPLYGDGETFSVTVTGVNNYSPPTPTPTASPTPPGPTATPIPLDQRSVMPSIARDGR